MDSNEDSSTVNREWVKLLTAFLRRTDNMLRIAARKLQSRPGLKEMTFSAWWCEKMGLKKLVLRMTNRTPSPDIRS